MKNGFSILEVILAIVIFATFSSGAVVALLGGLDANRLGKEETIASQFASEGIEAAKSIKNQAYTNLLTPNPQPRGAIRNASNVWQFTGDGTNNILISNGKSYTRTVKVESVNRDGGGNIVTAPAGSYDVNTKKVSSTVTWNFNQARLNTVTFTNYLSDWERAITSGILVYGDSVNNPASPKYRTYTASTNIFSSQSDTFTGQLGRAFAVRTSPLREEAIAGYVTSSGLLQIFCYDGIVWYPEWTAAVGPSGTTTKPFDIAYETNSGDAMVVYSTNQTSNEIGYRTKPGNQGCGSSNWSSETRFDSPATNGIVQWVKIATDRRSSSNWLFAAWADNNSELQGAFWDGNTWTQRTTELEGNLQYISSPQDVDSFDLEFESLSGDLMIMFSSGNQRPQYRICSGGASCTWSNDIIMPTLTDDPTNMDLSANPNTDEMVFASIGKNQSDLQVGYWSGSGWTNRADTDTTVQIPVAGSHLVATGWLTSGGSKRAIVVYNNNASTVVSFRYLNPPSTWTPANGNEPLTFNPSPAFANPQKWYDIQMDPKSQDQLMLMVSDISGGNNRLFAKKLTMTAAPAFNWSNADGGAALELNLAQAIGSPFGFTYWIKP